MTLEQDIKSEEKCNLIEKPGIMAVSARKGNSSIMPVIIQMLAGYQVQHLKGK